MPSGLHLNSRTLGVLVPFSSLGYLRGELIYCRN